MLGRNARPRIMVLGGGFGGLEAALYMRMKMPRAADITLVSDKDYFLFKPNTIYIPFGLDPNKLKFDLAPKSPGSTTPWASPPSATTSSSPSARP